MANRFPLVVDTSDSNKIKELPSGDNLQLSGNDVVGVVNITGSGTLTIESVSATNISLDGTSLADVATSGSYNDLTNKPSNVSTFTNDSNYVTPGSNVSLLTNDAGYLTTVAFGDLTGIPTTLSGYGITDAATSTQGVKADSAVQPGSNISTFLNDSGYITLAQVQNGDLTVDVNNSGDLIGSVFGQDSTILIDAILSSVNVSGTIRGHVLPRAGAGGLYDIGSAEDQFKDIHISGKVNGKVDGDVTGSVFADDSSVMVDAVNNTLYADNVIVSGNLTGDVVATDIEIDGALGRLTFDSLTSPEIRNRDGSVKIVLFGEDLLDRTQLYAEANEVYLYSTLTVEQSALIKGDVTAAAFKGTFVGDDSSVLVDGVNGKLVGDYENGTSTIGISMVRSYDVVALQDLNTLDSYVNGTLYGGATANAKNLAIGSTPPTDSTGADGDRAGMIAFDSTSIYYCIANWASPGTANIWVKQDWGTTGAWS